jgi:hypothetical protein
MAASPTLARALLAGTDRSETALGNDRAYFVGSPNQYGGVAPEISRSGCGSATCVPWLNTSLFTLPAIGTYGNVGKGAFRGPGRANTGLTKNFYPFTLPCAVQNDDVAGMSRRRRAVEAAIWIDSDDLAKPRGVHGEETRGCPRYRNVRIENSWCWGIGILYMKVRGCPALNGIGNDHAGLSGAGIYKWRWLTVERNLHAGKLLNQASAPVHTRFNKRT